jgi:hypothetical protein
MTRPKAPVESESGRRPPLLYRFSHGKIAAYFKMGSRGSVVAGPCARTWLCGLPPLRVWEEALAAVLSSPCKLPEAAKGKIADSGTGPLDIQRRGLLG